MSEWKQYLRTNVAEMRPHIVGENLDEISVNSADKNAINKIGGMIARNPENHADQWYVAGEYFRVNFTPVRGEWPDLKRMNREGRKG